MTISYEQIFFLQEVAAIKILLPHSIINKTNQKIQTLIGDLIVGSKQSIKYGAIYQISGLL
ncbi:MAG: hypothetical protein CBB68_05350 [Rhodospirillaceae bacterium TMED8]|nr:hypothetical protein [Magnetovibrio sp.]OUT51421.1 MAG: hypothetical protein CBB68_05350 [Rhodospirillaceae bacterium TMED8]